MIFNNYKIFLIVLNLKYGYCYHLYADACTAVTKLRIIEL